MRYFLKLHVSVGDTAIDFALLNAIARLDPDCHIEVLSYPGICNLLEETEFIDKVHVRPSGFTAGIRQQARLLRSDWDVVLVTRNSPRLQLFYLLATARHKRCRRYMGIPSDMPEMAVRVSMLEGILEGWKDEIDPTIHFNPDRIGNVSERLGLEKGNRYLAVAPGAAYEAKRWDRDKFIELTNSIAGEFDRILVLGSNAETERCEYVAQGTKGTNLAGKLELLDICALETLVSLHIGNDSGLGHLAAASGTNVVAVGDASGPGFSPWKQHILLGDPKQIDVKKVLEFLKDNQLV